MSRRDADHRAGRSSEFWCHTRKGAASKMRTWRKLHKGARQESKMMIAREVRELYKPR